MDELMNTFEQRADETYRRFAPVAARYYYSFKRTSVTCGGVPCMVFLGNHSSGKSSLINWILGGAPVQDVGLAPTDDGFTVILYGETEEDICGPAAVSRLPTEFRRLDSFGGSFLQHLKVKVRSREILRSVTLVDSPGMIDSAEGSVSRTYDFEGIVKLLAELCDMVFFLLDPDKPGTTGETVNVFSHCLSGVEFKLRVLLNKCDAFTSTYDFARTYGTVCWNLARVLHTKDLPKIWTLYSGDERKTSGTTFDLSDFNAHRNEFTAVIRDAASRRMDNVFAQAVSDFLGLSVRMRVMNHAARRLAGFRVCYTLCALLLVSAGGLLAWQAFRDSTVTGLAATSVVSLLGLTLAFGIGRLAVRFIRAGLARRADDIFQEEYRRQIAVGTHDNVRQLWAGVRDETIEIIRSAPLHLPLFGEFRRSRMDAAAAKVLESFHRAQRPS